MSIDELTEAQKIRIFMEETVADLVGLTFPRLAGQVRVIYKPRCPYSYAVRRSPKHGILLVTGMKFSNPKFLLLVKRAAKACLEVHTGTTNAVAVRLEKGSKP